MPCSGQGRKALPLCLQRTISTPAGALYSITSRSPSSNCCQLDSQRQAIYTQRSSTHEAPLQTSAKPAQVPLGAPRSNPHVWDHAAEAMFWADFAILQALAPCIFQALLHSARPTPPASYFNPELPSPKLPNPKKPNPKLPNPNPKLPNPKQEPMPNGVPGSPTPPQAAQSQGPQEANHNNPKKSTPLSSPSKPPSHPKLPQEPDPKSETWLLLANFPGSPTPPQAAQSQGPQEANHNNPKK